MRRNTLLTLTALLLAPLAAAARQSLDHRLANGGGGTDLLPALHSKLGNPCTVRYGENTVRVETRSQGRSGLDGDLVLKPQRR